MEREDDRYYDEEGKKPKRKASSKRRRKNKVNIHVIILVILGLLLLFALIRLVIWHIGSRSGFDPDNTSTEFDTEPLDYMQALDPALLEGRVDDGVTTILALGNDPFSDETGSKGLASLLAKEMDAQVLNAAFPGSTIATKNVEYQSSYPLDGLSLYWVVAALANQNFDLMNAVVADLNSPAALKAAETLSQADPQKVDMIVIFYDLQDYMGKRIVYDGDNDKNINSLCGALNASIQLIQETWPHIRIVVLSAPYGTYTDGDGTQVDPDRDDFGHGTLADYLNWQVQICCTNGVSIIDNYYGTITMEDTDCLVDGYHLNQKGRQRVAERFAKALNPD